MRSVVIDGAHDHAARPGSYSSERRALEFAGLIARFHIFHFAVLSIGDPNGKDLQLGEVADWRNAAEIEAGVARALLDAGWKVGQQVGSGSLLVQLRDELISFKRLPLSRQANRAATGFWAKLIP